MYNLYKYQEDARQKQAEKAEDEHFTKWLLRHEQLKNKSVENMKNRVTHFVHTFRIVQDDHYKTWRYHRQFRDVEDSNKFIGFKSFRHKPNYDIGKHYSERERKQIDYLANRSKMLIDNKLIPDQHRSRSLRSQGPLNPKHTFRDRKRDHQLLQPRMRYTNITDKERILENSVTFDDKFHKVYKSFSLNKSQIGVPKISPVKDKEKSCQLDMMSSTFSDNGRGRDGFYYDANNQEDRNEAVSKIIDKMGSTALSPLNSEQKSAQKKRKVYFKTAKTMALHGDPHARYLMIQTQYDRKKDLTNLNKNLTNQSFVKRPIL